MAEKKEADDCDNKAFFEEFALEVVDRSEDEVATSVDGDDFKSSRQGRFYLL